MKRALSKVFHCWCARYLEGMILIVSYEWCGGDSVSEVLIIDSATVRKALSMDDCIDAMQDAAVAVSQHTLNAPLRSAVPLYDKSGTLLLMPGSISDPQVYGAKLISLHGKNPAKGLPAIQGFVSLFDHQTGAPIAFIEGVTITAIRTAAASAMATRLLARQDAKTHGVFGAGVQAKSHIQAIHCVRPAIEETLVWARDRDKADQFVKTVSDELKVNVRAAKSVQEVAGADIVTTVTASPTPILQGKWLADGAHINLVGGHTPNEREADTDTITRSHIFVETLDAAFTEAGDLIIPQNEGVFSSSDVAGEIGAVALGHIKGRICDDEVTLYKSLGNVSQDLYAAWVAYTNAQKHGLGTKVSF